MKLSIYRLIVVVSIAVLAGCSSKGGTTDGASIEDRGTSVDGGAVTSGYGSGASFESYLMDNPDSPLQSRVIYFEWFT